MMVLENDVPRRNRIGRIVRTPLDDVEREATARKAQTNGSIRHRHPRTSPFGNRRTNGSSGSTLHGPKIVLSTNERHEIRGRGSTCDQYMNAGLRAEISDGEEIKRPRHDRRPKEDEQKRHDQERPSAACRRGCHRFAPASRTRDWLALARLRCRWRGRARSGATRVRPDTATGRAKQPRIDPAATSRSPGRTPGAIGERAAIDARRQLPYEGPA